ncbi:MAG: 50S ribosomal protein L11 methyltransferase [Candidatus Levyibacteriota bacterium]
MIFNLVLFTSIIILLIILSMVWPPGSPWAPWWKTSGKTVRKMCKLAKITDKDIVFDLGSGDGTALIIAAKEFEAKGIGIEIDPLRFFISKFLIRINGVSHKVKIKRDNFFNQDLSGASVIFLYLVPKTLNLLLPKFKKELKKGTKLVSYRYEINLPLAKEDKENNLYLYKIF